MFIKFIGVNATFALLTFGASGFFFFSTPKTYFKIGGIKAIVRVALGTAMKSSGKFFANVSSADLRFFIPFQVSLAALSLIFLVIGSRAFAISFKAFSFSANSTNFLLKTTGLPSLPFTILPSLSFK